MTLVRVAAQTCGCHDESRRGGEELTLGDAPGASFSMATMVPSPHCGQRAGEAPELLALMVSDGRGVGPEAMAMSCAHRATFLRRQRFARKP